MLNSLKKEELLKTYSQLTANKNIAENKMYYNNDFGKAQELREECIKAEARLEIYENTLETIGVETPAFGSPKMDAEDLARLTEFTNQTLKGFNRQNGTVETEALKEAIEKAVEASQMEYQPTLYITANEKQEVILSAKDGFLEIPIYNEPGFKEFLLERLGKNNIKVINKNGYALNHVAK